MISEQPPRSKSVALKHTFGEQNEIKRVEDKQSALNVNMRGEVVPSPLDYNVQESQHTQNISTIIRPQENITTAPRRNMTSCDVPNCETPSGIIVSNVDRKEPGTTPNSTI